MKRNEKKRKEMKRKEKKRKEKKRKESNFLLISPHVTHHSNRMPHTGGDFEIPPDQSSCNRALHFSFFVIPKREEY